MVIPFWQVKGFLLSLPILAEPDALTCVGDRQDSELGQARGPAAAFDKRPTWDNWAKKEPPFSKKTHYFGKKN